MEILNTLMQLGRDIGQLGGQLYPFLLSALLPAVWIAWWLWGVNWQKAFPVLFQGAWVPLLLLTIVSALVWSRIAPSNLNLGFTVLYNFWWQLAAVGLLVGVALACGWFQLYMHWSPPEINLDPPSAHAAGDHDHGHGHDAHAAHGQDSHGHETVHESHH